MSYPPLRVICVQPADCDYTALTPTFENAVALMDAHERRDGHLTTFTPDP